MKQKFTAVYKKCPQGYIGWVEEVPGVNTQGATLKETKENLAEALFLVIETNRSLLKKQVRGRLITEPIMFARA